jgi:hypothetical protein
MNSNQGRASDESTNTWAGTPEDDATSWRQGNALQAQAKDCSGDRDDQASPTISRASKGSHEMVRRDSNEREQERQVRLVGKAASQAKKHRGVRSDDDHSTALGWIRASERTNNDVLCGRGRPLQRWPGNIRMHRIVASHRQHYRQSSSRTEKFKIIRANLRQIKGGGGRFLKRLLDGHCQSDDADDEDHVWVVVDDVVQHEKVRHALGGLGSNREGAGGTIIGRCGSGPRRFAPVVGAEPQRRALDEQPSEPAGSGGTTRSVQVALQLQALPGLISSGNIWNLQISAAHKHLLRYLPLDSSRVHVASSVAAEPILALNQSFFNNGVSVGLPRDFFFDHDLAGQPLGYHTVVIVEDIRQPTFPNDQLLWLPQSCGAAGHVATASACHLRPQDELSYSSMLQQLGSPRHVGDRYLLDACRAVHLERNHALHNQFFELATHQHLVREQQMALPSRLQPMVTQVPQYERYNMIISTRGSGRNGGDLSYVPSAVARQLGSIPPFFFNSD